MWMSFWNWLGGLEGGAADFFGAVIGFVLGFLALVGGALINAHLNRRRDDRLQKAKERSVEAALYGELIFLREELARVARSTAHTYFVQGFDGRSSAKFDKHFLERNQLPDPMLYPALAGEVGLLPPSHLLAITRFHSQYRSASSWLPRFIDDDTRKFHDSPLSMLEIARSAIEDIEPTLRKIEAVLGITTPPEDPDLKKVIGAIEHERRCSVLKWKSPRAIESSIPTLGIVTLTGQVATCLVTITADRDHHLVEVPVVARPRP